MTFSGELRCIDLVFIQVSEALSVDLMVRFEVSPNTGLRAGRKKVSRNRPHKNVMARELGVRTVQVYGFPLGAHCLWPKDNDVLLSTLGLGSAGVRSFARLMSRRTILYSLDILQAFNSLPP